MIQPKSRADILRDLVSFWLRQASNHLAEGRELSAGDCRKEACIADIERSLELGRVSPVDQSAQRASLLQAHLEQLGNGCDVYGRFYQPPTIDDVMLEVRRVYG